MIDPTFFSKLDALSLTLRRQSFGKYQGDQKTAYVGDGLTFKDFSPYTLGDDFRKIDWRVYARTKELYVRRYEADKNLTIHVLLDSSASMGYKPSPNAKSKFDFAATMALGIAHVAQKQQERVEFSLFSHKIIPLKNQNQQIRVQQLATKLNTTTPKHEGDLGETLKKYTQNVKSKSLLFIVSDFLYPPEELAKILKLYQKSQVFLIHVLHHDEITLPFEGDTKFVNPENESESVRAYVSPSLQRKYQKEMIKHTLALKQTCGKKAKYVQINTFDPAIRSFMKLWSSMS